MPRFPAGDHINGLLESFGDAEGARQVAARTDRYQGYFRERSYRMYAVHHAVHHFIERTITAHACDEPGAFSCYGFCDVTRIVYLFGEIIFYAKTFFSEVPLDLGPSPSRSSICCMGIDDDVDLISGQHVK